MRLRARSREQPSPQLHAVIVPDFAVLRERKIVNVRDVIRFDVENLSLELPDAERVSTFDLQRVPLPRTDSHELDRAEILRQIQAGQGKDFSAAAAKEPTEEDARWLADPRIQKAIEVIRRSSKARTPVLPSSNLELDLGFDSIARVELLVALEREIGMEVDARVISNVYTVREIVDAVLQSGHSIARSEEAAFAGSWNTVLALPPDDPRAHSALKTGFLLTVAWFIFGRFVSIVTHLFFGLRVRGKEKLPRKGPFILSPNHQSFIDPPILASQLPWRVFKNTFYLGTTEIFGQGFLRFLSRTFRLVPVDPDSNLVEGMRAAALGLRKGYNLVLYPEGERTIDGTPKTFKKGAAILSTHFKVPIYPVALEGFYQSWPRGRKFPQRARLFIQFGDPIHLPVEEQDSDQDYATLTEKLRRRVVEMWKGLREQTTQASAKSKA